MPDDLPALPATPPGRYRHDKGGEYEVVGAARHSETLEPLVVYRPLHGAAELWVRPHAMFFSEVEVDGQRQPRFRRIGQAAQAAKCGIGPPDAEDAKARRAFILLVFFASSA